MTVIHTTLPHMHGSNYPLFVSQFKQIKSKKF